MSVEIEDWLESNRKRSNLKVKRIKLHQSKEWSMNNDGQIVHQTQGFFKIIGVKSGFGNASLFQPLIDQPEIGILGFLIRPSGDAWEVLCQAKTEPGNLLETQIAPTFQATESNYLQIHGGQPQSFSNLFLDPNRVFIADQLQSEQGFRFWKKRNRNCVTVLTDNDILEESAQHRWISLTWVLASLDKAYLFNTDFRSVLVQLFFGHFFHLNPKNDQWLGLSWKIRWKPDLNEQSEVRDWITERKQMMKYRHQPCGLQYMTDWDVENFGISSASRLFAVRYFDIACECREVGFWDQPLMTSLEATQNRLLICVEDGHLYFLLQFRVEPGAYDIGELSCTMHTLDTREEQFYPKQMDWSRAEERGCRLLKAVATSEEGGRFYQNKTLNEIFQIPTRIDPYNENYRWVSLETLCELISERNMVTNELRTMLSILLGCQMGGQ